MHVHKENEKQRTTNCLKNTATTNMIKGKGKTNLFVVRRNVIL